MPCAVYGLRYPVKLVVGPISVLNIRLNGYGDDN